MNLVGHVFAGIWAAGVLAAIWHLLRRPSPPLAESEQERDLRDWLDGQM
ncbi:hypothetical protein [Mesorhizobium tamadayense]|nr:hypothetical protein [Mesorhizobium tamadayense]